MPEAQTTPLPATASRVSATKKAIEGACIPGGIIFIVFGLLFMSLGVTLGAMQQYRLLVYRPVRAIVNSSTVRTHSGSKQTTYSPDITYSYSVNGRPYHSHRVSPVGNVSDSGGWAWDVVARYPAGTVTTAWVSPSDASSAFLLHEADMLPFIFVLFPAIFVLVGIYAIVITVQARRPPGALVPDQNGWFRIAEEGKLRGRVRICAVSAIGLYLFFVPVIADYAYLNRGIDLFVIIASAVSILISLAFLVPLYQNWRLCHDFLDADMRISQNQIRAGDTVQLRLRQRVIRPLEIEQMSLGLICICDNRLTYKRGVNYVTSEVWTMWKDLPVHRIYQPGSDIDVQGHFSVPHDALVSSALQSRDYPRYRWQFALGIITAGEPKLTAFFPVTVDAAQ